MSDKAAVSSEIKAQEWLKISPQFRLGHLPTEQAHPLTRNLSDLAKTDLHKAIQTLLEVEISALKILQERSNQLNELHRDILATLNSGHKIYFCGCGATGRLSLSIESLWRELVLKNSKNNLPNLADIENRVLSFMAGADYALVRSIENFEDFPEFGARQLHDLGFENGDLLIATTEGGETPFVIGATLEAARISKQKPYFMYCNPDEVLTSKLARCREVISNPNVVKICLPIGPMAITGSTRLQATTVLMLAAGSALLQVITGRTPQLEISSLINSLKLEDFMGLAPLIEFEAAQYQQKNYMMYATTDYPLVVLTDLTERSPTFSLAGFENTLFRESASDGNTQLAWSYLLIPNAVDAHDSWKKALFREPRCLEWDGFKEKYGKTATLGFDFSLKAKQYRKTSSPNARHYEYTVLRNENFIEFTTGDFKHVRPTAESLLVEHLLVKVSLNITSNLVMCRMGRVEGNVMMWVRASNNKLIDRVARYVQLFLERNGVEKHFSYEQIVELIFKYQENLPADEPIVLKVLDHCRKADFTN